MAGKYQTYPEYKNSGVIGLDNIPVDWDIKKIKHLFDIGRGRVISQEELVEDGEFPVFSSQTVNNGCLGYISTYDFDCNQITWTTDGANAGTVFIREGKHNCTNVCGTLQAKNSQLNLNYFLYSLQYVTQFYKRPDTNGAKIMNGEMAEIFVANPTVLEKKAIANFLDHETAKIDTLIDKQQQLIQLLKEKRQAVISHAVTKGLNPNAPMRDSGVEWLGEVPEHWITTRLKYMKSQVSNAFVDGPFGSNLKSEHFLENGDVYVIESNFATTGLLDTNTLKKISNNHYEKIKRSSAKGGDIIIAKIGARYGSSSILPEVDKKAVVSGNSLKLTVNESLLNVEYANELLRVLKQNDAMDDGVNVTAQPALSLGGLNNLPFLKLPIEEQNKIISYIKSAKNKYNELISNADMFINLAKERRTALISAAVTGKIDVRHPVCHPAGNDTIADGA